MIQTDIFFKIITVTLISFFSAFVKEINDKAKSPNENFLLFISEVLLNGTCGSLIAIFLLSFVKNIYLIIVASGIGGLLGMKAIKLFLKVLLAYIKVAKNIDMDTDNIEKEIDEIDKDE